MVRHAAHMQQVTAQSYLVFVNQVPVFLTSHAEDARGLTNGLERLFNESNHDVTRIMPAFRQGRYAIGCPKISDDRSSASGQQLTTFFEFTLKGYPTPWLEAEVVAENIRSALRSHPSFPRQKRFIGIKQAVEPSTVKSAPVETAPVPEGFSFLLPPEPVSVAVLPDLQTILNRIETERGNVVLYTKTTDEGPVFAGFEFRQDRKFELDEVATILSAENVGVSIIKLFEESETPVLRIQGIFGANTLRTYYYALGADTLRQLFVVEGTANEIDLDNDGKKEIIAVSGIPSVTKTYTWDRDKFIEVDVNLTIRAESTSPSEETPDIIEKFERGTVVERYRLNFVPEADRGKSVVLEEI